jgi:SpoVK/Ycf46/Vps4 family AAA+-type ATPase
MKQSDTSERNTGQVGSWQDANREHLDAELSRLRLTLHRRILWLRQLWKRDPLQGFREWVISDTDADRLLAGNRQENAAEFYRQDPAAVQLSREIATQTENAESATLRANAAGSPPALEILARLFHLDDFDREVLVLCLAPELDPAFERLYAYVQDDATRKFPTAHLALDLFGHEYFGDDRNVWSEGWKRFVPEAPLTRSRLIRWDSVGSGTRCGEALRLEGRICDYLIGLNRMDEHAVMALRPIDTGGSSWGGAKTVLSQLEQLLRNWNGRGRMPAINLTGKAAGTRGAAADLCARLGVSLFEIDLARLPSTARERQDLLRVLERDAVLLPSAFFLDLTEFEKHDRAALAVVQELILDLRSFLIVASRESWKSERALIAVEVPKPSTVEQREAWKNCLGEGITVAHHASAGETAAEFLDALVQQFDFNIAQIRQASDAARATAQLRDPSVPTVTTGDVWKAARAQFSSALRGLADRIVPVYNFEDLVLPADTLQQLREIASQVAQRSHVYEGWGFGERLSRGKGIAALFAGPSGTGKTMAAEVLAKYLSLDLYRVDLAGVVSKYIGETEKNLRHVFDAAEESGAILFFDEADALFGKRSEVHDSHDRFANIEINYLLQRMEDYRGLAILATNMKSLLDQAFLRRLRFLVDFPFPSVAERMRIWQGVFPARAETQSVDYAFLSRLEIAGGNIKNIAMNAAFLAAAGDRPIGMQHVLSAARREYTKIDKLVLESEFGRYFAAVHR